jgi:TrmH family RNA methyltransferase
MAEHTGKMDSLIRALQSRHGRKKSDKCVCEGARCCAELVRARPDIIEHAVRSESFNIPQELESLDFAVVPDCRFAQISSTRAPQGVLLVARRPDSSPPAKAEPAGPFTVLLDRVSDPGNMGSILRTARAAGLPCVWLTKGCADPFGDKVIRGGSGAQFSLRICEFDSLETALAAAKSAGRGTVYRAEPSGGVSCFTESGLFSNSVIIFGNEGAGAGFAAGSVPLNIPMPGAFESLNVAQAATVIIFEYIRRATT